MTTSRIRGGRHVKAHEENGKFVLFEVTKLLERDFIRALSIYGEIHIVLFRI